MPHDHRMNRRLLLTGFALLLAGLITGLQPLRIGVEDCGSALVETNGVASISEVCDAARADARTPAVALLVVGGVLALGGLIEIAAARTSAEAAGASGPEQA
jgi:hypothetical protein